MTRARRRSPARGAEVPSAHFFVMVFVKDVLKGAREGIRSGVCNMFMYISGLMVFVKDVLKGAREGIRKGVCNMFIYVSYISGLMHICIYIYMYICVYLY